MGLSVGAQYQPGQCRDETNRTPETFHWDAPQIDWKLFVPSLNLKPARNITRPPLLCEGVCQRLGRTEVSSNPNGFVVGGLGGLATVGSTHPRYAVVNSPLLAN
jgi:hypothetical protein